MVCPLLPTMNSIQSRVASLHCLMCFLSNSYVNAVAPFICSRNATHDLLHCNKSAFPYLKGWRSKMRRRRAIACLETIALGNTRTERVCSHSVGIRRPTFRSRYETARLLTYETCSNSLATFHRTRWRHSREHVHFAIPCTSKLAATRRAKKFCRIRLGRGTFRLLN